MDVVYVVRPGNRNEELRYSLRSLVNLTHDRVWIVGYLPDWVRGVEHIPTEAGKSKYRTIAGNIRAACEHPDVSDPFTYFNDDFFVLKSMDEVPVLHRGTIRGFLAEMKHRVGQYSHSAEIALAVLESLGYEEPLSYEGHKPLPVHKGHMLKALDLASGMKSPAHVRTVYGNLAGLGGSYAPDAKIRSRDRAPQASDWFVSTADKSFRVGEVGEHIRSMFPAPSPYEK